MWRLCRQTDEAASRLRREYVAASRPAQTLPLHGKQRQDEWRTLPHPQRERVHHQRVSSRVPHQGVSSRVLHQRVSSRVPHQGVSSRVPHQGVSSLVPHQGVSSRVPHQRVSSRVPHQGVSSRVPHQGVSSRGVYIFPRSPCQKFVHPRDLWRVLRWPSANSRSRLHNYDASRTCCARNDTFHQTCST